jgi:rhomboid protease GluP
MENDDVEHPELTFARQLYGATPRVFVTPALVAINVAVFVAMLAMGVGVFGGRPDELLKFGANFGPLTTGGEWWRLVTCTFVHAGIMHIAFNMWALWDSGYLTERLFGNAWFAAIYLFAGVTGSLASMLWRAEAVSVGASGAIFGVFGALLAYTIRQRGSIPPEMTNRLRISTSIFVTYSLFYGFAASGIDNAAHLGGLAGGFILGLVAARPLERNARAAGHWQRIALALLIAAIVLPSAAHLAPDSSRVYREAVALEKAVNEFADEDRRLGSMFEEVVKRARDGRLNDRLAANELRNTLLPAWDRAIAALTGVEIDEKAPLRRDYDLLLRYAHARRDMTATLAEFLDAATPANRERFSEKRLDAENALKEYSALQAHKN